MIKINKSEKPEILKQNDKKWTAEYLIALKKLFLFQNI